MSGDAPLTVNFVSTSTGDISSLSWDFNGDGITDSTDGITSFRFQNPGTYSVTLTVGGPGGENSTTAQIQVNQAAVAPVASIRAQPMSGDAPLTVNFLSISTGDITRYSWDFDGDGVADSLVPEAQFTFQNPGTYSVTLTVGGPGGENSTTAQIQVNQAAVAPVASIRAQPMSGDAPLTVNFLSISTGDITRYSWDFDGDGVADSLVPEAQFTFQNPGTYSVTLTVGGPGGEDSTTAQIQVNQAAVAPVASIRAQPMSGDAPLTVNFLSISTGDITRYSWDFDGDGVADSLVPEAQFTFQNPGTYSVTLTVGGPGGENSTTAQIQVNQAAVAPVASIRAQPMSGDAPLTVNFLSISTGDITRYSWDFDGDGVADSLVPEAQFTFQNPGTYSVTLTVGGPGGEDSTTIEILVNEILTAPTASFVAEPMIGNAPLTVNFTSTSTGDISAFAWDFNGDGVPDSTQPIASFMFQNPGTYNVSLMVTGPGGQNSTTAQIQVNQGIVPPTASFTAEPPIGNVPLVVNFFSSSTGDIAAYSWDFNSDGIPDSTEANTIFTYQNAGTFTATLTVTGMDGSTSTASSQVTVNAIQEPNPNPNPNPNPPPNPNPDPPSPSPTSDEVVFVSNRDGNNEIYIQTADGEIINITNHPAEDLYPTWSPNGAFIAFVSNRDGHQDIYRIDVQDLSILQLGEVTRLTNDPSNENHPSFSPDSVHIAYTSNLAGDNDIWIMNVDGTQKRQVTFDVASEIQPTWSPDGSRIAYTTTVDGNREIAVLDVGSTSFITNLTGEPSNESEPSWSPDGSRIVFTSDRFGDNDIFTMNANDGSNVVQLTTDTANDSQPSWARDSQKIFFTSNREGGNNIFSMNANDGSQVSTLTPPAGANILAVAKP